ncbi:hypothetical protein QMP26_31065 [Enterocloster clostridioformis]|uniref:hypothetical protein n=1 Tax=Enterocloster clostridioformis TaxID=1531 RepID=UPI0026767C3F|nr:hypothetical protein [Enterocloster clostridioformis]
MDEEIVKEKEENKKEIIPFSEDEIKKLWDIGESFRTDRTLWNTGNHVYKPGIPDFLFFNVTSRTGIQQTADLRSCHRI